MKAYILAALASWIIVSGWLFADLRTIGPSNCRERAGVAVMLGGLSSGMWPVGLPAAYLITGFAEHGWLLPLPSSCERE